MKKTSIIAALLLVVLIFCMMWTVLKSAHMYKLEDTERSPDTIITHVPTIPYAEPLQKDSIQSKTLQDMVNGIGRNINRVGVWEMIPDLAYTVIFEEDGKYFMQDIYMDRCKYGDKEELKKSGNYTYRFMEENGESFVIKGEMMFGYSDDALACRWPQVL
jgi:hypothetical protein